MAYQPKSYRKFVATAATATLVAGAVAPFASAADASKFTDVSKSYQDAVNFVVSKGANGKTETTFGTSENITRVDAAVLLVKVLGLDTEGAPASGFKDVPARAVKEVNALKAAGITSGKSETTFNSNAKITRGELAVWIQRGFALEGSAAVNFKDVNSNYYQAVSALVANKVTSGKTPTTFGTSHNATRGEYAIFLYKAFQASDAIAVSSVKAINATTVEVTYKEKVTVEDIAASKYTIDGLEVKNAAIKQTDSKTVVLTTAAQEAGKSYTVKNNGTTVGSFTGVSAVIPTGIKVVEQSIQGVLGQEVTVKAQVTVKEGDSKAGVPVTFNITSNDNANLNAPQVVETTTNADGVATYTYTRYANTIDTVTAYATGDRTKFSTGTVYWAAAKQLTVKDITEATTLVNGSKKVYEINSANNAGKYVFVAFEENVNVAPDKAEKGAKVEGLATYTIDGDNKVLSQSTAGYPYQYSTGGKAVTAVKLDSKGKANLVVTGSNASVTPIVYADTYTTNTAGTVLEKVPAYTTKALQAKASTVKFELKHELGLTIKAEGVQNAATWLDKDQTGGRDYTVTYTTKDGKPASPTSKVKVAIDKAGVKGTLHVLDVDGKEIIPTTSAATPGVNYYEVSVAKEGKAAFTVSSTNVNDYVTPVAFIDNGKTAGSIDTDDLQAAGEITYFVGDVTYAAELSALDANGKPVTAVFSNGSDFAEFVYELVDQNGKPRSSKDATTVSFEVKAGTGVIKVDNKELQPGETKVVDAYITAGKTKTSVKVTAATPSSVTVTAIGSKAGVVLPTTNPASVTVDFSQYGTNAVTGIATNVNLTNDVFSINNVVYSYAAGTYKFNNNEITKAAFEEYIKDNNAKVSITKDAAGNFTFNVIGTASINTIVDAVNAAASPGQVKVALKAYPGYASLADALQNDIATALVSNLYSEASLKVAYDAAYDTAVATAITNVETVAAGVVASLPTKSYADLVAAVKDIPGSSTVVTELNKVTDTTIQGAIATDLGSITATKAPAAITEISTAIATAIAGANAGAITAALGDVTTALTGLNASPSPTKTTADVVKALKDGATVLGLDLTAFNALDSTEAAAVVAALNPAGYTSAAVLKQDLNTAVVAVKDTKAPSVQSIVIDGTKLTLTFDENIALSAVVASLSVDFVNGKSTGTVAGTTATVSGNTLELTLTNPSASAFQAGSVVKSISLSDATPAAVNVVDKALTPNTAVLTGLSKTVVAK